MKRLGRIRLQDIAIVLVLVFFGLSGAIPGIAPNQASAMTGAPASRLQAIAGIGSQLLVDLTIAALLFRHARLLARHAALLLFPLALGVWAVLSTAWSVDPLQTGRRALPFLLAAAFGALLAIRLPPRKLLILVLATFAILACWSALLALAFPAIGLDASTGHSGDWQGVFTQKNACGRAMVLALAVVAASTFSRAQASLAPLCRGTLLLLFGAELLLSGSRGAWLIAAVLALVMLSLRAARAFEPRPRAAFLACGVAALAAGACAAVLAFARLAPLLGRDATLTGRTEIWRQVWIAILHRPWLGYGFSAFWRGASGPSWDLLVALHFVLFHAHNGFLEIWLELGALGLLLFCAMYLRAAVLLWPELRLGNFAESAWPLAILLLTLLYNLDENSLLSFNALFWVLYSAALTRVELLAAARRNVCRSVRRPLGEPAFATSEARFPHIESLSESAWL